MLFRFFKTVSVLKIQYVEIIVSVTCHWKIITLGYGVWGKNFAVYFVVLLKNIEIDIHQWSELDVNIEYGGYSNYW